eukprot:10920177-Ditylum_brightwellii.AAC.1
MMIQNGLPKWRITFCSNEVTQDGVEMMWCSKHKMEGKYGGMYYPKLHDHDVWLEKVKNNKEEHEKQSEQKKQRTDSSSSKSLLSGSDKSKLVLDNNFKVILCTNCGLSDDQVKEMVEVHYALVELVNTI